MNKIIISIEVQDNGGKEATIIERGEWNNQIMFEEKFDYGDEEKHPLRLHLLKERFINKFPKFGDFEFITKTLIYMILWIQF